MDLSSHLSSNFTTSQTKSVLRVLKMKNQKTIIFDRSLSQSQHANHNSFKTSDASLYNSLIPSNVTSNVVSRSGSFNGTGTDNSSVVVEFPVPKQLNDMEFDMQVNFYLEKKFLKIMKLSKVSPDIIKDSLDLEKNKNQTFKAGQQSGMSG